VTPQDVGGGIAGAHDVSTTATAMIATVTATANRNRMIPPLCSGCPIGEVNLAAGLSPVLDRLYHKARRQMCAARVGDGVEQAKNTLQVWRADRFSPRTLVESGPKIARHKVAVFTDRPFHRRRLDRRKA